MRVGQSDRHLNGLGDIFDCEGGIAIGLRGFHLHRSAVHTRAGPDHALRVLYGDSGLSVVQDIQHSAVQLAIRIDNVTVIPDRDGPEAVAGHQITGGVFVGGLVGEGCGVGREVV